MKKRLRETEGEEDMKELKEKPDKNIPDYTCTIQYEFDY